MTILIHIGQSTVSAVVDTAAQVTDISKRLADKLRFKRVEPHTQLRRTAPDSVMLAWLVRKVPIQAGKMLWHWDVFVSDISDDFILGLDLLKHMHAIVDLTENRVKIRSDILDATTRRNSEGVTYNVSRIKLIKRVVIPPQSAVVARGSLTHPSAGEYVIQVYCAARVKIPHTLVSSEGPVVPIEIRNYSTRYVRLEAKQGVGQVVEAEQSQKSVLSEAATGTEVLSTKEIQHHVFSEPVTGTEQSPEMGCSGEETVMLKDSKSCGGIPAVRQMSGTSTTTDPLTAVPVHLLELFFQVNRGTFRVRKVEPSFPSHRIIRCSCP